jgi:hypothetical protein
VQTQDNNDTQGDIGGSTNAILQRPYEDACAHMKVHGFVAHRENIVQLD